MSRPLEMAVIAVGYFPKEEMQKLIEKHFGEIILAERDSVRRISR